MKKSLITVLLLILATFAFASSVFADPASDPWLTVMPQPGHAKPNGKTVVLISGDEEYRSEESMPQLARILALEHGFKCYVLFAIDPADGTICPNINTNIPGLEHLQNADLLIMLIRWRNLPDDQMKYIVDYAESGRPMIGLRTSTHAFNLKGSAYQKYSWDNKNPDYEGGFGRQIFGETWIAHHGAHGKEGTRGIIASEATKHPILKGIEPGSIFVKTDVYQVRLPMPKYCYTLLFGEVTESLDETAKAVYGPKNNPMMPLAWTNSYHTSSGADSRVFATTMGSAQDLLCVGFRRLLINAVYWTTGQERRISRNLPIDIQGKYDPSSFEFRATEKWKPGKHPAQM